MDCPPAPEGTNQLSMLMECLASKLHFGEADAGPSSSIAPFGVTVRGALLTRAPIMRLLAAVFGFEGPS